MWERLTGLFDPDPVEGERLVFRGRFSVTAEDLLVACWAVWSVIGAVSCA